MVLDKASLAHWEGQLSGITKFGAKRLRNLMQDLLPGHAYVKKKQKHIIFTLQNNELFSDSNCLTLGQRIIKYVKAKHNIPVVTTTSIPLPIEEVEPIKKENTNILAADIRTLKLEAKYKIDNILRELQKQTGGKPYVTTNNFTSGLFTVDLQLTY